MTTLQQIPNDLFLEIAQKVALKRGYDPSKLRLCNDNIHKLEYNHNDKWVKFGALSYNDFINYLYNNYLGIITFDEAVTKMKNYRKRAKSVMEKSDNPYSPSSLSYNILW